MKYLALVGVIALAGCSSEAENLERQYEIVNESGSNRERCEAANEAADAWLRQEDQKKYQEWRSKATFDCFRATLP